MNTTIMNTNLQAKGTRRIMYLAPVALLVVLLLAFFAYRSWFSGPTTAAPADAQWISQAVLEEQYGVRINLIAVTAAGGLVDMRLKIVDAEKARLLVQESNDVPKLYIGDDEALLTGPEDAADQLLSTLEDDGSIFLMYPNVAGVLAPGKLVTVQFGDIWLEPIPAQ